MATVKEVLIQARELIADPERWTQGTVARIKYGEDRMPTDEDACQFCAIGALARVAPDQSSEVAWVMSECAEALAPSDQQTRDAIPDHVVRCTDRTDHAT